MVSLNDFTDAIAPAGTALTWSTTSDLTNTNAHLSPGEVNNPSIGVYYGFYYDSTNDCASPPLTITLVQNTTPTITEGTGETRCGPGEVTLMGSATGNATFNWYASETGGAILETGETFTLEINQTTTFYLEATENGCATSTRVPVVATILVQPSAGTAIVNASSCNDPEFGSTTIDLDDLLTDADVGEWSFTSGPEEVPFTSANMVDFNDEDDGTYEYTFTTTGAESPCVNESVTVSISVSSCDTDDDGDGLLGGVEAAIGTDPNNDDSDGDGIKDDVEVGPDINNPLDEDGDGIIDALDSNEEDSDNDGVVDQEDPGNDNACIPDINNDLCEEPIDLEVVKTIDNPDASIGDEVTFTITVTNLGPRRAKSVLIGDFLVEDADEMYTNTAELLASDPLDSNPDNNSSTIALGVEQPEGVNLVIEKTARLSADSERLQNLTGLISGIDNDLRVEYFIKVSNKSLNDAVSNIRVTDVFSNPSNVIFEIIEEVVPQGSTFDASSGIWTINRQLAIDEEIELSYTVAFRSRGIVVNTAEVTGSSPRESTSEDEDSRSAVTVEVTTRNPLDIGILYNQFSPNADGINDFLEVNRLQQNESGIDTLVNINYDIEIYDRYGSLVYEAMSVTEEEAWDGTWKGKQVPDGTYFYALNVMVEGETEVKTSKGWIQLIR